MTVRNFRNNQSIGNGKAVDIVAEKGKERIAIEIETGKSDMRANLAKCQNQPFTSILMVGINESVEQLIKSIIDDSDSHRDSRINVLCARREEYEIKS